MGKRKRATRELRELQIRTRTELSGKGESRSTHTVHCPRQHLSVSVHECAVCPRAEMLFAGPGRDQVLCNSTHAEPIQASIRSAAEHTPVSSIMSHDVMCVREDVSLEVVTSLLLDRAFSGLPVVDDNGHAIGVVSKTDLIRYQRDGAEDLAAEAQLEAGFHAIVPSPSVSELMTPVAFTVPEEASIASAAAVMAARNIHRLPVVDHLGTVVGLLTTTDIVDWVAQGSPAKLMRRDQDTDSSRD